MGIYFRGEFGGHETTICSIEQDNPNRVVVVIANERAKIVPAIMTDVSYAIYDLTSYIPTPDDMLDVYATWDGDNIFDTRIGDYDVSVNTSITGGYELTATKDGHQKTTAIEWNISPLKIINEAMPDLDVENLPPLGVVSFEELHTYISNLFEF